MKMKYVDAAMNAREGTFNQYGYTDGVGKFDPATSIKAPPGSKRDFVAKSEFDGIVDAFGKLQKPLQEILQNHAKVSTTGSQSLSAYEKLNPTEKTEFQTALGKQGLGLDTTTLAVINDKVFNNSKRGNEAVFDVNGRPIVAGNMNPAMVSFYHGASLTDARKHFANQPPAVTPTAPAKSPAKRPAQPALRM